MTNSSAGKRASYLKKTVSDWHTTGRWSMDTKPMSRGKKELIKLLFADFLSVVHWELLYTENCCTLRHSWLLPLTLTVLALHGTSPLHWDPRARHNALSKLLGAGRTQGIRLGQWDQGEAHSPARPDLKQGLNPVWLFTRCSCFPCNHKTQFM